MQLVQMSSNLCKKGVEHVQLWNSTVMQLVQMRGGTRTVMQLVQIRGEIQYNIHLICNLCK